jgi:hypothetical protein
MPIFKFLHIPVMFGAVAVALGPEPLVLAIGRSNGWSPSSSTMVVKPFS